MAKLRPISNKENIIKLSTRNHKRNQLITKVLISLWIIQTLLTIGFAIVK